MQNFKIEKTYQCSRFLSCSLEGYIGVIKTPNLCNYDTIYPMVEKIYEIVSYKQCS